jgi:DNA-directed RNA polymerase subunit RPC12/RpoP
MDDFLTLSCPSCGAKVSVSDDVGRYRCDYCGNEHIMKNPEPSPAVPLAIRPVVAVPSSVRIEKDGQSARIVQRWFSLKYIPMALFCVAWDGFLIFWYGTAFATGAPWIMIVFPIVHLALGVGLTYSTLCGFFNRTVLEVTREELAIWFDPLPWGGEKTIKVSDLKQLYCKEKVTRGENSTTRQYQLFAVTQDNKQVQLVSNLDSPDVAVFIEQQIERWLKIGDRPVSGEYRD